MESTKLVVLCSGQPGFLRGVAGPLVGRFRLVECYSINEAAQMVQLHHPEITLLDLRNSTRQQLDRSWAMCQNSPNTQLVVVTESAELQPSQIPAEISARVMNIELAAGSTTFETLITAVAGLQKTHSELPASQQTPMRGDADQAAVANRGTVSPIAVADATPDSCDQPDQSSIVQRYRTHTPALRQMLERLDVAARHDVTILLIGETGSGKTHLARLIHESSNRRQEPLLTVACGALPQDLIESELFGHVKGSFTSAHADKQGKFVAAGRGTILLDEIDALSPEQQVKLLRVIERGLFEPVGSNETLQVKARIIAASNLELQPLVEQGRFRPDLYYRLNTLTFSIPPLRQRLPDVEPLARYFVNLHSANHKIDVFRIADEFVERLISYPWPGNVRELENAIRSAVIYCRNGELTVDTLPPNIIAGAAGPGNDSAAAFHDGRKPSSLGNRIELTEKEIIQQALLSNAFSRTRTADQLGISRVTLYNKMKKYDMMPGSKRAVTDGR